MIGTAVSDPRIAVLAGGVGGARFVSGLVEVVPPPAVTVIGNVGDDVELYGLHVSPDLDTILYTLAGWIDPGRGWGVRGDSDRALRRARELGAESAWFWLGDLDLGLHLARAERLARGEPLSTATAALARAAGVLVTLLPATDDPLRTFVRTPDGELDFQTYYVRRRHADAVLGLRFDGEEAARPAPGVLDRIAAADVLVLAPSNPLLSLGPILAVKEIREALRRRRDRVVAVSPIVDGEALRGPAADMLRSLGREASPAGVAELLRDVCGCMVLDRADEALAGRVAETGMRAVVADTVMHDAAARRALARSVLAAGAGAPARA
jgi:LPPG:FO 2-phospho-L-lactate transferase